MSLFKTFAAAVAKRYNDLARGELFVVDVSDLFATYLAAFPDGTDPIFRVRTVHDCNADKNFIRRLGHVIAINPDGTRASIWDHMDDMPHPYNVVAARLAAVVQQAPIKSVFRSKERVYGSEPNWDNHDTSIRWEHFVGRVTDKHHARDPETKRGERDAIAQVLRRGLEEINVGDLETVIDLIDSNSLYRGAEHLAAVKGFRDLQRDYLNADNRETFVWGNLDNRNARFRNTVIGTLLTDLAAGTDLDAAVRMFESKVAPANYKRPTALITPKMIDTAVAKLKELGLEGAVERRMATIEDVSVNDVLFVDNSVRGQMREGLAGLLDSAVKPRAVKVENPKTITVDEFLAMSPTTVDLLVQNKHTGNFVTLTAPQHANTGKLFKWDNDFAWSYDGEVTDSIKQRVKAAGGNVTGDMRVSLGWSNADDLDIHCQTPRGEHIYFGSKAGILDVDMNAGGKQDHHNPVENMAWRTVPADGEYKFWVNQFSMRKTTDFGFTIEVEFMGQVQQFSYDRAMRTGESVEAVTLVVRGGKLAEVRTQLPGGTSSTAKWGVNTETLVPVDTIMFSPNHWDGAGAVGNKHLFFILKGCKNPDAVRGIYNEFLRGDLDQHRKVFEVLGAKTKCPPTDSQLSGVGFSSTKSDEVTVVVDGKRAFNIKF